MAFHRNNNGSNNRYNNRQNFRPRHTNNQHHNQQGGGQRRHVNRINHVFESTGPDGRVRGTAQQLVEKYTSLARDAHGSGDPVLMLNYYQHAEHYQRLYAEIVDENSAFERERESQRAQYNQQPVVEGDAGFAPQPESAQAAHGDGDTVRQPHAREPRQADEPRQTEPRHTAESRQTSAAHETPNADSGAMSTGGRVMGRRPAAARTDSRSQANQLQDDHMPSFLKDIPIKSAEPRPTEPRQAAPKTPKAASSSETAGAVTADSATDQPATAAFGKRRTPAAPRRAASDKAPDKAPDTAE